MVAIKSINGNEPIIEPMKMMIAKSDIYSDSTGRSAETGTLMMYPIRLNVYTIELEYEGTDTQISAIEAIISNSRLTVIFRENGEYITKTMYPSDRQKDVETLRGKGLQILTFSLIEY